MSSNLWLIGDSFVETIYSVLAAQGTEDLVTGYSCNKAIKQMLLEDYNIIQCLCITILNVSDDRDYG